MRDKGLPPAAAVLPVLLLAGVVQVRNWLDGPPLNVGLVIVGVPWAYGPARSRRRPPRTMSKNLSR